MNSRFSFLEYLKHFKEFADLEYERKRLVENARWAPVNIYSESQKKIAAARGPEGQIGELGRIFNEFPIGYEIEEKGQPVPEVYYAIDPRVQSRWLDVTRKIVTSNEFDSVPHPEMPDDPGSNVDQLNEASQKEASAVMQEMIQESVNILLDLHGNLSAEIVEALGINDIIPVNDEHAESAAAKQLNRAKRDKIVFQVVYSFVSQIMIGGIRVHLDNDYVDEFEVNKKIIALSKFFETQCMQFDERKVPRITDFFKKQVMEALFDKSVYSEEMVGKYLTHIPDKEIGQIVNDDIYGVTNPFWNFMPHDQADYNELMSEMLIARGNFWLEIMKYLQAQGDVLRLRAVMKVMPESRLEKWRSLKNTIEFLPEEEEAAAVLARTLATEEESAKKAVSASAASAASSEDLEERKGDPVELEPDVYIETDPEVKNLKKWFNARDNLLLIDYILHNEVRPQLAAIDPKVKKVTDELENIKFNPQYIQLPTQKLFEVLFDKSKSQVEFLKLTRHYFPDLAAHLELRFADADEPLMIAAKNGQWRRVFNLLENMASDAPLDPALLAILNANKSALMHDLILSLRNISDSEKLKSIKQVVNKQFKLGEMIATPDANEFLLFLAAEAPQAAKLYFREDPNEDDLSIGLKVKDWALVVKGLLAKENLPNLSVEDKKWLYDKREKLTEALIDYGNAHYAPEQRIQLFDRVIEGKNALGKVLKESTSWFSLSLLYSIRDSKGNRVTSFIADIIVNRDTVQALLNSEQENIPRQPNPAAGEDEESKMQPPGNN
ncbi:MAG: hypothetical protein P4M14_07120 [Gammaproteobacteria bacterium]|nr:hypothetical protein [Gammaproteobacteria bacterium]